MTTIEELYPFISNYTLADKSYNSIRYLAACLEKCIEDKLEPFGLSPQQYRILNAIRRKGPAGVAVYALRKYLLEPKSDTSRLVIKLEGMGLVHRRADKTDKRKVYVAISAKGEALLDEIEKHQPHHPPATPDINPDEMAQLYGLLQKLVHAFHHQAPLRAHAKI